MVVSNDGSANSHFLSSFSGRHSKASRIENKASIENKATFENKAH